MDSLEELLATTEAELRDLDLSAGGPSAGASTSASPLAARHAAQQPLHVACIDDSHLARQMMRLILFPALKADPRRSSVLGATREEQLGFIDQAREIA